MSEAVFRIAYGGEAVDAGEMDIADLAPALLGISQLLKSAGRVIDGDDAEISVRVKAHREGSFEVWLNLVVNDAKVFWDFWKTPDVAASVLLLDFLGITPAAVTDGAIAVIRRLKGMRPKRTRVDGDTVRLEVDGDVFEVPEQVARLALDPQVRNALVRVVSEPLEKDGIESVSFGDPKGGQTITRSEAAYFAPIGVNDDDDFESRYTKAFTIQTLSFKAGQKWRLNDGRAKPLVTVSDAEFLARVDSGEESFAKGDMLICDVVERSYRTPTGFKSEYEIIKVREHRQFRPHPSIFGDEGPEAS